MQMPNVFTPNDDGINDFFIPDKKSLKFLNLQIFSKSGRRVYNYEGDGEDLQGWQGWDGKVNSLRTVCRTRSILLCDQGGGL